jgi:hypothetical protein
LNDLITHVEVNDVKEYRALCFYLILSAFAVKVKQFQIKKFLNDSRELEIFSCYFNQQIVDFTVNIYLTKSQNSIFGFKKTKNLSLSTYKGLIKHSKNTPKYLKNPTKVSMITMPW